MKKEVSIKRQPTAAATAAATSHRASTVRSSYLCMSGSNYQLPDIYHALASAAAHPYLLQTITSAGSCQPTTAARCKTMTTYSTELFVKPKQKLNSSGSGTLFNDINATLRISKTLFFFVFVFSKNDSYTDKALSSMTCPTSY